MIKKLSLICLLLLAACTQKAKEEPSFLFVIMSKHGELKQAANGSWELVLDHGDIEKVLAFSDRPYRIVRHMNAEAFKRMWREGSNSFAEDPPNATVIIDQHVQTVELLNVRVEGTKTTFTVRSDGAEVIKAHEGKIELFIEDALLPNTRPGSPGYSIRPIDTWAPPRTGGGTE